MTFDFGRGSARPAPDRASVAAGAVRVVIVDDHPMVRRGLVTFLGTARDIAVVGDTGRGREAADLARRLRPDVVLMDLVMPDLDGLAAIRATREAAPNARIIALTSFHMDQTVLDALQAGAISYLTKDIDALALADAVRAAYAGRSTLSAEAAQSLVRHSTGQAVVAPHGEELTPREHQVLRLMVRGLSNPQIASHLVVTRATVNFHVSNVLAKLKAKTRSKAVALALRNGLVAA